MASNTEDLVTKIAITTRIAQIDQLALELSKEVIIQKVLEEVLTKTEEILRTEIESHQQGSHCND